MDDAEPEVKVTDRRHFTAEGELRSDSPAESVTESATASDEGEGRPEETTGDSGAPDREAPDPTSPHLQEGPDEGPVTFSGFIISLATQAASLLGGEKKDLRGARQVISVLEMLKEKTEGRRTDEESKVIDLVLFDLRMAFVESAKGAPR